MITRRDALIAFAGCSFTLGATLPFLQEGPERVSELRILDGRPALPGLNEWVATTEDYEEIARLDAPPESGDFQILDNSDIPGAGDFERSRVKSAEECLQRCNSNEQCNAFTYARLDHFLPEKRHMCWLKSDENPETVLEHFSYVSGIRM